MSEKNKLPNMPLWADDWIGGTLMLSMAEEGLYLRLILAQWKNGPLPIDEKRLRRIARADEDEWNEYWPAVREKFVEVEGCFVNLKCADVTHRQQEYVEQKRRAGKASAEARAKYAKTPTNPTVVGTPVERTLEHPLNARCNERTNGRGNGTPNEKATTHTQTHTNSNTDTKSSISPEEDGGQQSSPRKINYSESFELFWKAYKRPTKGSKKDTYAQWKRKGLDGQHEMMIQKADEYSKSVSELKFMAWAERFISKELYDCEFVPDGEGEKPKMAINFFPEYAPKEAGQ